MDFAFFLNEENQKAFFNWFLNQISENIPALSLKLMDGELLCEKTHAKEEKYLFTFLLANNLVNDEEKRLVMEFNKLINNKELDLKLDFKFLKGESATLRAQERSLNLASELKKVRRNLVDILKNNEEKTSQMPTLIL